MFLDGKDSIETIEESAKLLLNCVRNSIKLPDNKVEAVTLSMGICVIKPDVGFEEAFAAADEALYKAKELGRNQYILAEDTVTK